MGTKSNQLEFTTITLLPTTQRRRTDTRDNNEKRERASEREKRRDHDIEWSRLIRISIWMCDWQGREREGMHIQSFTFQERDEEVKEDDEEDVEEEENQLRKRKLTLVCD